MCLLNSFIILTPSIWIITIWTFSFLYLLIIIFSIFFRGCYFHMVPASLTITEVVEKLNEFDNYFRPNNSLTGHKSDVKREACVSYFITMLAVLFLAFTLKSILTSPREGKTFRRPNFQNKVLKNLSLKSTRIRISFKKSVKL